MTKIEYQLFYKWSCWEQTQQIFNIRHLSWLHQLHNTRTNIFFAFFSFKSIFLKEIPKQKYFLNIFKMLLPTVHRCSVPLFFCPPNFGRSSSSSPQSLSQSTFHRAPSKGHNISSRKVCSAVFSRVFFCFVKKDRPLVTVCDNFVTICVPSFSPHLLLFSLVKR